MSQSLANIFIHIVFSTKQRQAWLEPAIRTELYPYTAKILKTKGCHPHQIGGTEDHIHILFALSKNISVSKLIEEIKISTSKWVKTKNRDFYWQHGYGAFSISPAHLNVVTSYISNQIEHHKKITFQDELRTLLKKYNVTYDERYLWN